MNGAVEKSIQHQKFQLKLSVQNPNPIKVVVASPVMEGTVEAPPMTAYSQQGPVTCTMKGGRPAPGVSMEVEGLEETSISNDSQIQTPNDKGVYETVQVTKK